MNGFVAQAGAIPWRAEEGRLEVLLIMNLSGTKRLVPKGNIEAFETSRECAAKEAFEEAGVRGYLHREPIGQWIYHKNGLDHCVDIYPVRVVHLADEFPERDVRTRCWFRWEEALISVSDPHLKALLEALPAFLGVEASVS